MGSRSKYSNGVSGSGPISTAFFTSDPGDLAGLSFDLTPYIPPDYNAPHAKIGGGGSDQWNPHMHQPMLYPDIGEGGSGVGGALRGLGRALGLGRAEAEYVQFDEGDTITIDRPDAGMGVGDELCPTGQEYHPGVGCRTPEAAGGSNAIKVTTEGVGSFFSSLVSGTWFGLPRWAVLAVAGAVAYKAYKRRGA